MLSRYRSAFGSLSAAAVTEVWPSVDAGALSRAFRGIEEQAIAFDNCSISATDVTATASCTGSIRYVPRVGSRNPRSESRTWRFSLRRVADRWLIDRVETR